MTTSRSRVGLHGGGAGKKCASEVGLLSDTSVRSLTRIKDGNRVLIMNAPREIPSPVGLNPLRDYRIWIRYSDGAEGEVDLSHLAGQGVFKLWDDYRNFEKAYITDAGAIAWSEAVEICPDATYMRLTGTAVDELFPGLRDTLTHAGT